MKKKLGLITAFLITLLLIVTACNAGDKGDNGLVFKERDDGSYAVIDYEGSETVLTIPASYKGKPVTSIAESAFSDCESLVSVTIPDSVTSIGKWAFSGCTGLTSITLPDGVKSIEYGTFMFCHSLVSITIPDSVVSIDEYVFVQCWSLTSITIPDSVTDIREHAFYECLKLVEVINLSSLDVSKYSWECGDVANHALKVHRGESEIVNQDGYLFYTHDGVNYMLGYVGPATKLVLPQDYNGKEYQIYEYAFFRCMSLESITIPSGVTGIGFYAFEGCTSLKSITIPDSMTSITGGAFSGCTSLTSITIPDSVTDIGDDAFSGCTNIQNATLPAIAISAIPKNKLKTVIVTCGASIDYNAFSGCTSLEDITIPNSVTSIGEGAFFYCTSMKSITIPDSVTTIGERAFLGCTKLVEVVNQSSLDIQKGASSYGYVAYYALVVHNGESGSVNQDGYLFYTIDGVNYLLGYTGADTELILPQDYNGQGYKIYKYAFRNCTSLESITIPDGVTSIGDGAFWGCTGLISITISDSLTNLGRDSFYNCTNIQVAVLSTTAIPVIPKDKLKTVVITSGSSIDDNAFLGCTSLESITIPDSVTSIDSYVFWGCTSLTSITVEASNTHYHSTGNCLIETESKTLVAGCKSSIIPDDGSVTSIGEGAFYGHTRLLSIIIPSGVVRIGDDVFWGCKNLVSITIPDSVTSIGSEAFAGCTNLESVTLPTTAISSIPNDKLKTVIITSGLSIDDDAFSDCTSLESISISNSVKSIGERAFSHCTSLETVSFGEESQLTSIGGRAFEDCVRLQTVMGNTTGWLYDGSSMELTAENLRNYYEAAWTR